MQVLRCLFTYTRITTRGVHPLLLSSLARFSTSSVHTTPTSASLALLAQQLRRDFDFYYHRTQDPAFKLRLDSCRNVSPEEVHEAARIPAHEYASWMHNLCDGSFADIANRISQANAVQPFTVDSMDTSQRQFEEEESTGRPIPFWVLLSLVHTIRTADDAHRFAYFVFGALPGTPEHCRPALLLTATRALLALGTYEPMQRLVTILCGLPIFKDPWPLNHFLDIISRFVDNSGTAHTIMPWAQRVLDVIHERNMRLSHVTYRKLAQNKYIAAELGKNLRLRREGAPHVDELVHIFRRTRHTRLVDLAQRHDVDYHLRKNTLASTPHSVIEYLHALLDAKTSLPSAPPATSYNRRPMHYERQSVWVGRLAGLASDPENVSSETLLAWFWQPRPLDSRDIYAYTILINGLIARKAFGLAVQQLECSVRDGLPHDRLITVAAVKALTLAGKEERALYLMHKIHKKGPIHRLPPHRQPVSADGGLAREIVNACVEAMLPRGRPHMAFHFWDHGRAAFGSAPDATSLAAVLTAARITETGFESVSDSLRKALVGARLLPRQKIDPRSLVETREEALEALRTALGVPKQYHWRGASAAVRARALFVHLLFEEHPRLRGVRAPELVPSDRWTPRGLARRFFMRDVEAQDVDSGADPERAHTAHGEPLRLATSAGTPRLVTRVTVRAYVHLLGPQLDQARVLAWIRELGLADRRTIAFALVYFAEALANEVASGLTQGGEYHQLLAWVREWAGDSAPKEMHLVRATEQVLGMRTRSRSRIVW